MLCGEFMGDPNCVGGALGGVGVVVCSVSELPKGRILPSRPFQRFFTGVLCPLPLVEEALSHAAGAASPICKRVRLARDLRLLATGWSTDDCI